MNHKNVYPIIIVVIIMYIVHLQSVKRQSDIITPFLRVSHNTCIGNIDNSVINDKLMKIITDTEELLSGTDAAVHFGTLLHFYRECTLLPDTNDIDFALPYYQITNELINKFKLAGYTVKHNFGVIGTPGFEIAVVHPLGVKVDLFGQVTEQYYSWCPLWVNNKLRHCRYPTSTIGKLSIGNGKFVTVRQPIEPILSSIYGQQWREPVPTKRWNWVNPVCT